MNDTLKKISALFQQLNIVTKKSSFFYSDSIIKAIQRLKVYKEQQSSGRINVYILGCKDLVLVCSLALIYPKWFFYVHDTSGFFDLRLYKNFKNIFCFNTKLDKWRTNADSTIFTPAGPQGNSENCHAFFLVLSSLSDVKKIYNKIKMINVRILLLTNTENDEGKFDDLLTCSFVDTKSRRKNNFFKYWAIARNGKVTVEKLRKYNFNIAGLEID